MRSGKKLVRVKPQQALKVILRFKKTDLVRLIKTDALLAIIKIKTEVRV